VERHYGARGKKKSHMGFSFLKRKGEDLEEAEKALATLPAPSSPTAPWGAVTVCSVKVTWHCGGRSRRRWRWSRAWRR
jgi:hypothetical protein